MVLLILFFFVLLFSLINGLTLAKFFLAVLFPLLPTFIWAVREYLHQNEAANDKDELRKYSEELWEKAISQEYSVEKITEESRILQDEIYNNRRTNPFILDWFYNRLKGKNEEQMNVKAEELVDEALQSLNKKPWKNRLIITCCLTQQTSALKVVPHQFLYLSFVIIKRIDFVKSLKKLCL